MSPRLKPLSEQTMIVTGATSGNGLAIACAAAAAGARVVLVARNGAALAAVRGEIERGGGQAAICIADVAEPDAAERIAQTALHQFGGFDTWVNNAAAAAFGTMEQLSIAEHRRIMDVNYFGLLQGSLVAARHLRTRGGGAIINLGSVLSEGTMIFQGAYCASKHAIKAATDALRMELERDGAPISVTLIQPSAIHTPYPEKARNYLDEPARLPPVLYDPRLVADAVLFAAQHPRRSLRVGSAGQLIALGELIAPRLSDRLLETFGRRLQTAPTAPGDPAAYDNLFEPREDGAIDGQQPFFVRRTSLLLAAQKFPARTLGIVGGVLALTALALARPRRR